MRLSRRIGVGGFQPRTSAVHGFWLAVPCGVLAKLVGHFRRLVAHKYSYSLTSTDLSHVVGLVDRGRGRQPVVALVDVEEDVEWKVRVSGRPAG
jgi:hypothetical protein